MKNASKFVNRKTFNNVNKGYNNFKSNLNNLNRRVRINNQFINIEEEKEENIEEQTSVKEEIKKTVKEEVKETQKEVEKEVIKTAIKKLPLHIKLIIVACIAVLFLILVVVVVLGPDIGGMLGITNNERTSITSNGTNNTNTTTSTNPTNFPVYIQSASEWGSKTYSSDNATLSSAGCGVCSSAMIMAGFDSSITPITVLDKINSSGKVGPHQSTETIPYLFNTSFSNLNLTCSRAKYDELTLDKLDNILNNNGYVIKDYHDSFFNGYSSSVGHYVAIVGGNKNDGYIIRDSGASSRYDETGHIYNMATDKIPGNLVSHHASRDYYYEITNNNNSSNTNLSNLSQTRQTMVNLAESAVGGKYVYGGSATSPDLNGIKNGVDCSGFVSWLLWAAFDDNTRWNTDSIRSSIGTKFKEVKANDLKPGDIGLSSSHTGVYVGNGLWIHASTSDTGIIKGSQSFDTYLKYYKEES